MSTVDAPPSSNGHGSHTWAQSWTHFSVDRRSPGYCRVTFNHPPADPLTAAAVSELSELVDLIQEDADLNVVVFDSAAPDYCLAQYDTEHDAWPGLLVRLSRAPVLSIASIRGPARGAGREFVLACDLRFASRENALLDILLVAVASLDHEAIARAKSHVDRSLAVQQRQVLVDQPDSHGALSDG